MALSSEQEEMKRRYADAAAMKTPGDLRTLFEDKALQPQSGVLDLEKMRYALSMIFSDVTGADGMPIASAGGIALRPLGAAGNIAEQKKKDEDVLDMIVRRELDEYLELLQRQIDALDEEMAMIRLRLDAIDERREQIARHRDAIEDVREQYQETGEIEKDSDGRLANKDAEEALSEHEEETGHAVDRADNGEVLGALSEKEKREREEDAELVAEKNRNEERLQKLQEQKEKLEEAKHDIIEKSKNSYDAKDEKIIIEENFRNLPKENQAKILSEDSSKYVAGISDINSDQQDLLALLENEKSSKLNSDFEKSSSGVIAEKPENKVEEQSPENKPALPAPN